MKHYTKKNKKSKLAKGFLCFLLALCPMMMNVSKVQAVEQNMGNYILDLEEGRLWAEKKGDKVEKARKTVFIKKVKMNYYINDEDDDDGDGINQFNTIDWEITFDLNSETLGEGWSGTEQPAWSLILPKTDLSRTRIKREYEGDPNIKTLKVNDRPKDGYGANIPDFTYWGTEHRYGYINYIPANSKDEKNHKKWFDNEFTGRYQHMIQGTESGSNMNWWRDSGRLSEVVMSNESRGNFSSSTNKWYKYIKLQVTTYHTKDTILENVPMFAELQTQTGFKQRIAAIGPFGIASYHDIRVPKRVYVDDIDHLTKSDLERVYSQIHKDRDLILEQHDDKYRQQEEAATEEIIDNNSLYVRTYSDGSKLKLPLKRFVRQRELFVKNQENVINWKDSVDIALGVNDPEFKNEMIAMPAEGVMPAGLGWDEKAITTDVPNGKIRGIPDIDWSKVAGTPGSKEVTFNFNIALRKEDGTINNRPETYKPITITVRQDEGAVPVGVEDFPTTPFVLLSMISFSTIMIIFLRRRTQQE